MQKVTEKQLVDDEPVVPELLQPTRFETDSQGYLYDPRFREVMAKKGVLGTSAMSGIEAIRSMVIAGKLTYAGFEDQLAELGISHQQYRTMMCISYAGEDGTQLHPIAEWLGVTPRNVTGLVDALEAQGLAERVPDPRDRRAVIARLTPAGETKIKKGRAIHEVALERVMGSLTEEEKLQLRHLSLKVLAAAEEVLAQRRKSNG
jgi:DNA-binding MarR family transcriptional regulator